MYEVEKLKQAGAIVDDRGSQYMSKEYREFCTAKRIMISYSRKGNSYDNTCIE